MLRAGVSVEDVIERTGADPDRIESYATPIRAERTYVVQRAQTLRVGHVSDAPTLGDLVVDRLAARQVPTHEIVWDATRADGQPWQVSVTFPVGGVIREARWTVDLDRHVLTACDDESRWLSETDLGSSRRNLPGTGIFTIGGTDLAGTAPAPLPDERESLLAQLSASRGTRGEVLDPEQMAEMDELAEQDELAHLRDDSDALAQEEDGLPDSVSAVWDDVPGAHPADSAPHEAPDAAVLSLADRMPRDARAAHPSAGVPDALGASDGDHIWDASDDDAEAPEMLADVETLDIDGGAKAAERAQDDPTPEPVEDAEPAAPAKQPAAKQSAAKPARQPVRQPAKRPVSQPAKLPASRAVEEPSEVPEEEVSAPKLDVDVPKAKPRRKGSRRSVPSWDEIVFGTRSD